MLCQGEKAKSVGHEVLLFCPEGFETAVAPEDKATLAFYQGGLFYRVQFIYQNNSPG